MKFFKNKKGFTLVELVVVIAILGILAGIAIPRFMDATATARGARLVADMRTIESAESMYYAQKGEYGDVTALKSAGLLAADPVPPTGAYKVTESNKSGTIATSVTSYTVTPSNSTSPKTVTISAGDVTLASLIKS